MFKCPDITNELLANLYEDPAVSEVILINNTEEHNNVTKINVNGKLQIHSKNKNLYVNPSWNLGVSVAKESYLGILNDDIIIAEGLFSGLSKVAIENLGVIGASHGSIMGLDKPERFLATEFHIVGMPERTWGFGVFMVIYKNHYSQIPEDMKIWCGDDYIYHQNRIAGRQNCVLMCPIKTKMSMTSNNSVFEEIKNNDIEVYNSKYKV
jgi:GT2 family glycosyltransferase